MESERWSKWTTARLGPTNTSDTPGAPQPGVWPLCSAHQPVLQRSENGDSTGFVGSEEDMIHHIQLDVSRRYDANSRPLDFETPAGTIWWKNFDQSTEMTGFRSARIYLSGC